MSAAIPKPVAPGDRLNIRAATWNAIGDLLRKDRQGQPKDARRESLRWGGVVEALALNSTGADIREYKPATVTDAGGYELPTNDTAWQRQPLLTIDAPGATTDFVVVTLEAIPSGQIGRVAVAGVVLCDVDVTAGSSFASATVGSTASLTGGSGGTIPVLHAPASVGSTRRCVVSLSGQGGGAEREQIVNLCVVKSGGNVTDILVTWLKTDGTLECETAGECPGGDCATMWYCIDGTVTEVAVADAPPAGTAVLGPYRTEAEALAVCPVEVVCGDLTYLFTDDITVEYRNPTGCMSTQTDTEVIAFSFDTASTCTYTAATSEAFAGCGAGYDASIGSTYSLVTNKTGSHSFVRSISFGITVGYTLSFAGANGFGNLTNVGSGSVSQSSASSDDTRINGELLAGVLTIKYLGADVGTADLYLVD